MKTGKPIIFSCSWPDYERLASEPIHYKSLIQNCNMWRIYDDIQDDWDSVVSVINFWGNPLLPFIAGPGHWNDPDALMVGDYSLSYDEAKVQFGMWALFSAPLLMSVDIRIIDSSFQQILLNEEIIAINQDPLGIQGTLVSSYDGFSVWTKQLVDGSIAVALLNGGNYGTPLPVVALWNEIGLPQNSTATVRDLYTHQNLGLFKGSFTTDVNPHGIVLTKITILQ